MHYLSGIDPVLTRLKLPIINWRPQHLVGLRSAAHAALEFDECRQLQQHCTFVSIYNLAVIQKKSTINNSSICRKKNSTRSISIMKMFRTTDLMSPPSSKLTELKGQPSLPAASYTIWDWDFLARCLLCSRRSRSMEQQQPPTVRRHLQDSEYSCPAL